MPASPRGGIGPDERRRVLGVSVALSEAEVHWRVRRENSPPDCFLILLTPRKPRRAQAARGRIHRLRRPQRPARRPHSPSPVGLEPVAPPLATARTDGARWLIVLGGATWQRCRSSGKQRPTLFSDPPHHLARNAIHHAPNAEIRKRIGKQLKSIWTADDLGKAETALTELVASYRDSAPRLASWLEENVPEGLAVFTLPEHHRKRLRTSNTIERSVQQELKRRTVKVSLRRENSAPRCFLILLSPRRGCPPAPRQRRAGRDRQKTGLRHEGLHQVGMPGCMTRSQQNFQTSGCSIET